MTCCLTMSIQKMDTMLSNPVVSVIRKRGRPPGSKNRANQRDKSRFEYVRRKINVVIVE